MNKYTNLFVIFFAIAAFMASLSSMVYADPGDGVNFGSFDDDGNTADSGDNVSEDEEVDESQRRRDRENDVRWGHDDEDGMSSFRVGSDLEDWRFVPNPGQGEDYSGVTYRPLAPYVNRDDGTAMQSDSPHWGFFNLGHFNSGRQSGADVSWSMYQHHFVFGIDEHSQEGVNQHAVMLLMGGRMQTGRLGKYKYDFASVDLWGGLGWAGRLYANSNPEQDMLMSFSVALGGSLGVDAGEGPAGDQGLLMLHYELRSLGWGGPFGWDLHPTIMADFSYTLDSHRIDWSALVSVRVAQDENAFWSVGPRLAGAYQSDPNGTRVIAGGLYSEIFLPKILGGMAITMWAQYAYESMHTPPGETAHYRDGAWEFSISITFLAQ